MRTTRAAPAHAAARLGATVAFVLAALMNSAGAVAATTIPPEAQQPGTQPAEVSLEDPGRCANCHGGYNDAASAAAGEGEPQDEPWTGWLGGPMANAGRDPIFWATLAIAEQDFDGAGDFCLRCHAPRGWYDGNSTPTDGSGLAAGDDTGVDCDTCHKMTNPDDSELLGVMNPPFLANCSPDPLVPLKQCDSPDEGFYGSGMLSLWNGSEKLGPYSETVARHGYLGSQFHRDVDYCGSCHDVSNPVVGDLAPGHGAQAGAPLPVTSADYNGGAPAVGGPAQEKAAFNNPPYAYGIVERTFSEYKASAWPTTRVSDFASLPEELKVPGGSIEVTWQAAQLAGNGGDYADGTTRYFSCQSCHMRPVNSKGADKSDVPIRPDLPRHDHMGGNYWIADLILYQDANGLLRFGGGLAASEIEALALGQARAVEHLQQAASLNVEADVLKVVNLTGHKLISGYPEGRRMWLNVKWYDGNGALLREDGAYGPLTDAGGSPVLVENPADETYVQVESITDLEDPNLVVYEAEYAVTSEWAARLLTLGWPADEPVGYDRITGAPTTTLGELAAAPGMHAHSFHFALNDAVTSDNRIPPYGMRYDEAQKRNALPVPATQYGDPGAGGAYRHWDEIDLAARAPAGAVSAEIALLYQGTSWEYVQFLYEANRGSDPATGGNAFLGEEGENMLEAWINAEVPLAMQVAGDRKMVPPVVMATATWGQATSTYTVGGTVTGLEGTGLVLQNNGGDDLPISADGAFTFATALADGAAYDVTVSSQPSSPNQTCTTTDGSGTIASANVTDVVVTCVTETYTIGGTVTGLEGAGLVLQNNGGDDLSIAANGGFTFGTPLADGSDYAVTVLTQPASPNQTCTVTNGSGTLAGVNVTDVVVTCVTETYTVGGTVTGLEGAGLVLQNNGSDDLPISADGGFTFATPLADGSDYAVTVLTQPTSPDQSCNVTNASGTLAGSNVTDVVVTCVTETYTVGGTVTGLEGTGLVLQNNGGDDLPIAADGAFTFTAPLADGSSYAVTVLTQPTSADQTCTITNDSGTLAGADVTDVVVTCVTETYTVGGTVTGLEGTGLVLQNNGGDDLPLAADGSFTFATPVADGEAYAVTVLTQPGSPSQACLVVNGTGNIDGADVTSVSVTCATDTFTVGGTVTGLEGTGLVLRNNGGDDLAITSDGAFTFGTALPDGSAYSVTVQRQPGAPSQTCVVSNGAGTLDGADIDNVTVTCTTDRFTVGGTLSGLEGTGLVLRNNGGNDLQIAADGAFTFSTPLSDGSSYNVTVSAQPTGPSQTCSVTNGSGTVNGANIDDVTVTCTTDTFTVGGTVTGLAGAGLVLRNNDGDDLAIGSNGGFTFPTAVPDGGAYLVTVAAQPTNPDQQCSITGGSGTVSGGDVTNVLVECVTIVEGDVIFRSGFEND